MVHHHECGEQKERSKVNEEQAFFLKSYCGRMEAGLQNMCDAILGLLDNNLVSKAFSVKVKADHFQYIAGFTQTGQ